MQKAWRIMILMGIILVTGCGVSQATWEDQFLHEYIQNQVGAKYRFRGAGSQFAAMEWEILYRQGNKVQVVEISKRVKSALTYQVSDNSVQLIHYDEVNPYRNHLKDEKNHYQVLLKTPLEVGNRWEDENAIREIVAIDEEIVLPCGRYPALKVKKRYRDLDATEYNYFVKGVGFVKSEYISDKVRVITELEEVIPSK